ncbi:hypothetical protein THRCLA_20437 [Thraustotheca clavata]|uniref:Uncharacterized protein n=1 Tax=Thraustotheca clavata TaxID=74557 RepID=A0A1W0A7Z4_9STRA|nr:hypothetical protein THRCLA_20437 [Thraustotheca clavata]
MENIVRNLLHTLNTSRLTLVSPIFSWTEVNSAPDSSACFVSTSDTIKAFQLESCLLALHLPYQHLVLCFH